MIELPRQTELLLDLLTGIAADLDVNAARRRVVEAACTLSGAEFGMFLSSAFDEDELVNTPVEEPVEVPIDPLRDVLLVQVTNGGSDVGQLYLGGKRGGFTPTDEQLVRRLAAAAGPAIANARLHSRAERRRRWLEGTVTMAGNLARTVSKEEAEEGVVQAIHTMSGAPLIALLRSTGDGPEVTARVGDPAAAEALVDRLGEEIVIAIDSGELMWIDQEEGAATMVVPLQPRLAPPAVLVVDHAGQWGLLRGHENDVMETIASQVCLFLDRMHLTNERQRLLLATDRERIARDLHDLVIQRLFATGLQLQAMRKHADEVLDERLSVAVRDLDGAMNDLRSTVFELRKQPGTSLLAEVEGMLDEYAEALGFRPTLRYSGPVDSAMGGLIGEHLIATMRESLSNVARHSAATAVTVELHATPEEARLVVVDNGTGPGGGVDPVAAVNGSGNGLGNLQARAEELGGSLRVTVADGGGTRLEWVVPTIRSRI